jgi:L-ascorbate metabolism protein UlaG (beta-lactamase superfamily)
LKPKVVLPCHWDDFFLPYEVPARQIPRVDVEGFLEEVRRAGTGTEVALLDYFGEWRWRAQAGVERRAG